MSPRLQTEWGARVSLDLFSEARGQAFWEVIC